MKTTDHSTGETNPAPPHRVSVHLGGLIELLSDALYTSESVFIRELIQNGVDAITARRMQEAELQGEVHIQFFQGDDSRWRLTVEDNGIGLTEPEVHQFLATIGASIKRSDLEDRRSNGFLGQFGVGFLSCFMVADEVTLVTQRAGVPGAKTLEWRGRKDGTYTLSEYPSTRSPGATVYLTLREDTRETYHGRHLYELARKYAGFLPEQILFSSREMKRKPVNPEPFPWLRTYGKKGTQQKAWLKFAEENFDKKFLAAFPVECEEGGIRGMVCVMSEPVTALDETRHMVFLRGMFLSREVEEVAPKDMPFLRCIVNATDLKPNAAREGIRDAEASLAPVREIIKRGLIQFLSRLEQDDDPQLDEILRLHRQSFLKLASTSEEIMEKIIPHLPFETSLGPMTLREISKAEAAWYITGYEDYKKAELFAAPRNILVINGGYSGMESLFEYVRNHWSHSNLRQTTSRDLRMLISHESADTAALRSLLKTAKRVLRDVSVEVELSSDPQGELGIVDISTLKSLRRSIDDDLPDFLRDSAEESDSVFHLNAAHATVQRLCDPEVPVSLVEGVIGVAYYVALISAREIPTERERELYDRSSLKILNFGETDEP
jgi:molecular chaperone HtpG